MAKQLLPNEEWSRNVGTAGFPVSFLHEYAVGLLWDALQIGHSLVVKTMDGSMSGDLLDGVERIVIPDSMQPIGGCIPDLALLDKNLRPVRIVEVVVTSPPSEEKTEKLRKLQERGVEVVIVPVRNEEELKSLAQSKSAEFRPDWAYRWNHKVLEHMGVINIPRMQVIERGQMGADKQVQELVKALVGCSPEVRRQLVKVLQDLDSLESCYPLSPKNPKRIPQAANGDGQ